MSKSFIFVLALLATVALALVGISRYIRSHAKPSVSACVNNLRWIETAKVQWALENTETTNTLGWDNLRPFMKGTIPTCPAGGTYTIGQRGEYPICSLGTNLVPAHVIQ